MDIKNQAFRNGLLATIGLLLLYEITMTLVSGWDGMTEQFRNLWYLMLPLAIGFGIHVGLYTKLTETIKLKTKGTVTAGGATASVSMLACCSHHLTDVVPILGLSGLSLFLVQYQKPILLGGIATNLLGMRILQNHIRKLHL